MKKNYFLTLLILLSGIGAFSQLTAPFTESFTGGSTSAPPTGWNESWTTGDGWSFDAGYDYGLDGIDDHTGTGFGPGNHSELAHIDFSGTDVGAILQSDTIDISALTVPELQFFFITNLSTNTLNPLNVLYVEAYNGSSWVTFDSIRQDNMGVWTEHFYNMTPYIFGGSKLLVRFRGEQGNGTGSDYYFDIAIDDISVKEFSPCRPVINISSKNITSSSATIEWTSATGADTAWIVEYGAPGFTPGTGTSVQVSVDSADLTGLSPATIYDYYVTGLCNTGDTSAPVGPNNFITACLAGLSGAYTINPGLPTAGTNFNSFADFFATVSNCGLDAATIVNVDSAAGPYILSADIGAIPGASSTNTLTLNGNGAVINHGGGTYFLAMNGVTHLTINDFNIINETPNTQKFGIMMRGGCDSISITNNTINLGTGFTSSVSGAIVASNSLTSATSYADNANNVTIDNNTIIGGYYGIRLNGTSQTVKNTGNKITNNTIEDVYYYSIYNYYQDDLLIHNNDISRGNRPTITTFYGIYAQYSTEVVVSNNKIHNTGSTGHTCYPIYLGYSSNTVGAESYIVNNAVYDINRTGSGTFYGIQIYSFSSSSTGISKNINIWHNTVTINTEGTTGTTRGITTNTSTATYFDSINITNNIIDIYGSGSGTKYAIYTPSIDLFGGNNDIHFSPSAGTNNFAYYGTNQADLTAWETSTGLSGNIDNNPIIIAPGYTPYSNLVDNLGTPLASVTTDIDGVTRNATTPDMGCVEFVPSGGDLAILDGGLSRVSDCYGTNDTAWVSIKNLFGTQINFATDSLTVYFDVTGPINTSVTTVVNMDSLMVDSTMSVMNANIDMSIPGKYSIKAYINFALNNILAVNDSLISIDEVDVKPLIAATPMFDTLYSFSDSSKLSSQSPFYPAGAFLITEICQYAGATNGRPAAGRPAWLLTDDYIEITGVPGSDLAGITFEQWTTSGMQSTHTFPSGTVLSPNGTAIIATSQINSQTNNPSQFIYLGNGAYTGTNGSSTTSGKVLRDASGAVIDAVGYYGYGTFPAAAGVTTADWSAPLTHSSGTWGIRLTGPDNNTGSNWVLSTTPKQDPNTLNAGVPLPAPSSVAGLTWTDLTTMTVLDTTPEIYAKGFTVNGTYPIEAAFITPCGTYRDTSFITVLNQTYDTTIIHDCDSFVMPINGMTQYSTGFYTDTLVSTSAPIYDSIYYVYDVNIDTTNAMFTLVECDSLVSPSGKVWNTSGTYYDTITNSLGCDSLMVFNLTVNYASAGMFTTTECDTFIAPSGAVFRATGTYMDTIMNVAGCDSVITINLSIINSTTSSMSVVACDSYTGPTGVVWTSTGVYNDTLTNSIGCDSVIVFNTTINYSKSRTDNIVLCPGQTHRVGPTVYSVAGSYTDVFNTFHGCDSTIVTNLSFHAPATASVNYNFCTGDSVMILGNWYYAATTFVDTIVGGSSNGCDSMTTHNITTRTVTPALNLGNDVVACLDGGVTLFASNAYDTYNWSSGGTTNVLSVSGAMAGVGTTNHVLTVTQASSGCTATDDVNVTFNSCVGINEIDADLNVNLYPNPATNFVTIEIFDKYNSNNLKLEILNSIGQIVESRVITSSNEKVIMDVNNFSKGLYLVRISSDKLYMTKKLLIQK